MTCKTICQECGRNVRGDEWWFYHCPYCGKALCNDCAECYQHMCVDDGEDEEEESRLV